MERGLNERTAVGYRTPMPVVKAVRYQSGGIFPLCPQCAAALEFEYQSFCSRCGQKLDWKQFQAVCVISRV